jgi:hypothetical protein
VPALEVLHPPHDPVGGHADLRHHLGTRWAAAIAGIDQPYTERIAPAAPTLLSLPPTTTATP